MKRLTPFVLALLAAGCSDKASDDLIELERNIMRVAGRTERSSPSVDVLHILIGVKAPGKTTGLGQEDAKAKTASVLARVNAGEDFVSLMKEHSDDPSSAAAGTAYTLFDPSKGGKQTPGAFARSGMVPAFGDIGWRLDVGDIGVANYHTRTSPHGYHIIKRVR